MTIKEKSLEILTMDKAHEIRNELKHKLEEQLDRLNEELKRRLTNREHILVMYAKTSECIANLNGNFYDILNIDYDEINKVLYPEI